MTAKAKINKSEKVREILKEIGALSKNPPENWITTLREKLGDLKVSAPLIYQIRRNVMKKSGTAVKKLQAKKLVDFNQVIKVKKLADQIGLEALEQSVSLLKELT